MGILPDAKPKLTRKQKLKVLETKIKNRGKRSIDEVLAEFSREYDVSQRHLREDYIKTLLLEGSIEASEFKKSVLITKKFRTRLGVSHE